MSEEIISQIFDSSFTTKSVGKGTGLSISRQIMEETQGDSLTCSSVLGEKTEFTIALHLA
ncbi:MULTISPECIES: ATP-binding protein [unclassified Microcoleus]|uniref:ATP-binding protein n=1 Tax=unclassified Microcoleus TaxID=2642155 RepID=UPI004040A7B1